MPYYQQNTDTFATITEALNKQTVDQIKQLLPHLPTSERPTRKAELVALVEQHLQGKKLQSLWQELDSLQQAAVAEVVHSLDSQFDGFRFQAKYGQLPDFGTHSSFGTRQKASKFNTFANEKGNRRPFVKGAFGGN